MKNIVKCIGTIIMCLSLFMLNNVSISAADIGDYIDGSYLVNEDSSEVVVEGLTRGIYYKSGSSSISKAGAGKITAGGTTIAQQIVSTVSVTVRVERLVNGNWQVYTSWTTTRYNAASASSSKTLSVPTGYYYRTHCFHSANSDSSGSASSGLWI